MQSRSRDSLNAGDDAFGKNNFEEAIGWYSEALSISASEEEKVHCEFYTRISQFHLDISNNPQQAETLLEAAVADLHNLQTQYYKIPGKATYLLAESQYQLAFAIADRFTDFKDMLYNVKLLQHALILLMDCKKLYTESSDIDYVNTLKNKIHVTIGELYLQHTDYHLEQARGQNRKSRLKQVNRADKTFNKAEYHLAKGDFSAERALKQLKTLKMLAEADTARLPQRKADMQDFIRTYRLHKRHNWQLVQELQKYIEYSGFKEEPRQRKRKHNSVTVPIASEQKSNSRKKTRTELSVKNTKEKQKEKEAVKVNDLPQQTLSPIKDNASNRLTTTTTTTTISSMANAKLFAPKMRWKTPDLRFQTTPAPLVASPTAAVPLNTRPSVVASSPSARPVTTAPSSVPAPQPFQLNTSSRPNDTARNYLPQAHTHQPTSLWNPAPSRTRTGASLFKHKLQTHLKSGPFVTHVIYSDILNGIADFHQQHCGNLQPKHYDIVAARLFLYEKANHLNSGTRLLEYERGFLKEFSAAHPGECTFINDQARDFRYAQEHLELGDEGFFWKAIGSYLARTNSTFHGEDTQKLYADLLAHLEQNVFTLNQASRPFFG